MVIDGGVIHCILFIMPLLSRVVCVANLRARNIYRVLAEEGSDVPYWALDYLRGDTIPCCLEVPIVLSINIEIVSLTLNLVALLIRECIIDIIDISIMTIAALILWIAYLRIMQSPAGYCAGKSRRTCCLVLRSAWPITKFW